MIRYFDNPLHSLAVGTSLLLGGLLMTLVGVACAYPLSDAMSLGHQVLAHFLVMFGPGLIKAGYLFRVSAHHRLEAQGSLIHVAI